MEDMITVSNRVIQENYRKLISKFLESYEEIRDFVLEAPILSEDVYDLREYIDKIKERIIEEIEKWNKLK